MRNKLSKRLLTIALAVASLTGVSIVVGLDALPAGAVPPPSSVAFTQGPSNSTAGTAFSPTIEVTITNGTANASVTLSISTNPSGGTLTCTGGKTVTAVASVATFNGCSIDKAGTGYKLTANDTTDTLSTTSSSFDIGFGLAYKLAFTTEPGNGTVGLPLSTQPAVSVEDAEGNVVTTSTDSIGLSITGSPAGVTLTCTTNPLPATLGRAAFSACSINTAGTFFTLTATDTTHPLILFATSTTFTISGASHLAFTTEPGNGAVGDALFTQPVVSLENASDAVVTSGTGSTDNVTLSITGSPAGVTLTCIGGDTKAAVAGVAVFSGCSINKAGTGYTLIATDTTNGVVTSATSTAFTVGTTPYPIQISGVDAIGTAIAVSMAEFPVGGSAKAVVLARSDFFSDALAGGPLAAAVGGPLLITPGAPLSASLDPRVDTEIERVLPTGDPVYILGGDLALSLNIDATLTGQGYNVIREAGTDLYATAVDIAEALGNPSTIFEATGLSFFDALSAVPAAIEKHAAILLTDGSTEPLVNDLYLLGNPGDTRYAIGGPEAAYGADPTATPVYGQDLFSTSAKVAADFFPVASIFGAATAAAFPDALGGGVFMATGGRMGPLLLVNPSAPLPPEITPYLATLALGTQCYVFGGLLAVGADVLSALRAAVG